MEDAYSSRRRYAVDRLLYLIALLYPQINVSQVRANLFGDDLRRLYHLVPPELESEFTAAVEDDDSWLAACTLFGLSSCRQAEFSSLIHQGLHSPDALVREPAELAARQQFEPEDPITLHGDISPCPEAAELLGKA